MGAQGESNRFCADASLHIHSQSACHILFCADASLHIHSHSACHILFCADASLHIHSLPPPPPAAAGGPPGHPARSAAVTAAVGAGAVWVRTILQHRSNHIISVESKAPACKHTIFGCVTWPHWLFWVGRHLCCCVQPSKQPTPFRAHSAPHALFPIRFLSIPCAFSSLPPSITWPPSAASAIASGLIVVYRAQLLPVRAHPPTSMREHPKNCCN
jgi:hypothetical protein